jgi:hypothetical protein
MAVLWEAGRERVAVKYSISGKGVLRNDEEGEEGTDEKGREGVEEGVAFDTR